MALGCQLCSGVRRHGGKSCLLTERVRALRIEVRRCLFVCLFAGGINSACCEIAAINTKGLLLLANEVSLNHLNPSRKFVCEQA